MSSGSLGRSRRRNRRSDRHGQVSDGRTPSWRRGSGRPRPHGTGPPPLDVAAPALGAAGVLTNDHNGGFTLQQWGANATGGVGLADFDHDGDLDIVATDFNRSLASVLLNDGAGQFTPGAVVPVGYEPHRCTGADFGKDALPEMVTANLRAGSISFVANTT
jgi:hypothetical protein